MTPGDTTPPDGSDVPSRFQVDFTGRTLLGIYRVERRLAEGGMGSVHLAEDTNLGRRVVVKVPHARFLGEPGFRARFGREISELVRLEHPHVVRILARGEEDEVPYFVLQYLPGGSLEDRLRERPATPAGALEWLEPVARTLDFVHAEGVVHRDVKPANILFDGQSHVFLSDFGVVKALGADDTGERTEAGTAVGSPFYMAPEQALGTEVTPAADQYALASVLHEALTGEPPFGRGSIVEVMVRRMEGAPAPLRDCVPSLPETSETAILRALSREPADRFPTCTEFAQEYGRELAPSAGPGAAGKAASVAAHARWLALAALILVVGALTRWYGLAKPFAPSAPESPRGGSMVVLAERGAEPRRTYRLAPAIGATDRYVVRTQVEMTQREGLEHEIPARSIDDQEVALRVERVESDGRFEASFTLPPGRALSGEGIPEAQVAAEQAENDARGTRAGRAVISPQGSVLTRVPSDADESSGDFEDVFQVLDTVLPSEPIGVGAVWDVTKTARLIGIRYVQTSTYELVSTEGGRLRLRCHVTMGAPPQHFSPPGAPKDLLVKIVSMRVWGECEVLLDPALPVPLEYSTKQSIEMHFEAPVPAGATPKAIQFGGTFEGRIRRE